ncbi:MAG: hypothetical protein COA78_09500 [Blastopirellula sp.]|nr:MAG: hypothetical protein COA78_09500 [Blastopirellula sp.]
MNIDELVTRWSIRLALACLVLVLCGNRFADGQKKWDSSARALWSTGCLLFLIHIVGAFQFYHHWSHELAYQETARQTYDAIGIRWGGGIYINYLMAIVWFADVCWWWMAPVHRATKVIVQRWIVGFFLFMAFNGAIVFIAGPTRWVSLAVFIMLVIFWVTRKKESATQCDS